jgi:hypothetical protein
VALHQEKVPLKAPPLRHKHLAFSQGLARVSRLIGKSDTTAKPRSWQVDFRGTLFQVKVRNGQARIEQLTRRKKRHSNGVAFAVLRWSLASQAIGARWLYPLSLLQAVPAGNSLFEGPLDWRFLLPGVCVHWAGRIRFQQPVHHWRLLHSNPCTVRLLLYFQ